jgi:hypothetical protein
MKSTDFRLPNDLADLSLQALKVGHKIKLCSLLPPMPTREELEAEADLWEVADEIET